MADASADDLPELGQADALAPAPAPAHPPADANPREQIRRLFAQTLQRAAPAFAGDDALAATTAREIETTCYNDAVRTCKTSEEPPRRHWDSPPFVDIYSTRCGALVGLLDPDSSTCRAFGGGLVRRLLAAIGAPGGEGAAPLAARALSGVPERELCPEATAAERAEIAARSAQRVDEKVSILFRCPHCGARRCTYTEVQRRSLDEAADNICFCLECNRRFSGR
jgi:hypothetical protein